MLLVGPQALGAVCSQDLDGKARCYQAVGGLLQLQVEVLPQATQTEVDCFAATVVYRRRVGGQGSPSPAVMVADFMRDVMALVGDLVRRHDLIL